MSISIDQNLEVFRDGFHSFYFFEFQKGKNQRFGEKKMLVQFLSN